VVSLDLQKYLNCQLQTRICSLIYSCSLRNVSSEFQKVLKLQNISGGSIARIRDSIGLAQIRSAETRASPSKSPVFKFNPQVLTRDLTSNHSYGHFNESSELTKSVAPLPEYREQSLEQGILLGFSVIVLRAMTCSLDLLIHSATLTSLSE
jgi:hypothetical protein